MAVFRQHGGILRMAEAWGYGIPRRALYELRDRGAVERPSRGPLSPGRRTAAGEPRLGHGGAEGAPEVICLISALSFHELTTEIPH
jgi:hypothetical protein